MFGTELVNTQLQRFYKVLCPQVQRSPSNLLNAAGKPGGTIHWQKAALKLLELNRRLRLVTESGFRLFPPSKVPKVSEAAWISASLCFQEITDCCNDAFLFLLMKN